MDKTQSNTPDCDLDWLAYQYVAGELSDSQVDAFEQRLAVDQSAREAVAAAVELVVACKTAFDRRHVTPSAKPSPRRQTAARLAILAAALAACVTIAWLGRLGDGGSGPGLADRDAKDRGASQVGSESLWGPQLALIWADLGEFLTPEMTPLGEVTADAESSVVAANGEENDLAAPEWLIAALDVPADSDDDPDEG